MFGLSSKATDTRELTAKLNALDKVQAIIEFNLDGTILTANKNFLQAVGYSLDEVQGKNHSIFVTPEYKASPEYKKFWEKLGRGEFEAQEYKRITKSGAEIWIQASYNPVFDSNNKPYKVIKFATDITAQKLRNADFEGQMNAVSKSQAVIEFKTDGTILTANPNFLGALGYSLDEIVGKHHSMFVDPEYRTGAEYKQFWEKLARGEYQASQYKRIGKGGREIWIQASYNPILDLNGKPFKVVKYATDITAQVQLLENVRKLIDENVGAIDKAVGSVSIQTASAAAASLQTSANVQTVAAAAEELSASVGEIAASMNKSRESVDQAFSQATGAESSTQRLTASASAMSGIVELIQGIAGQINLLSLNATIESARAGEAGRGFAVVAGEVKNLAKQAGDATEQISREIEGIQAVSVDVVKALDAIKGSIATVREQVGNVAAAVEEQSAVTQEMSSNMQTASESVASITKNVTEIENASRTADHAVRQTMDAAKTLSK